MNICFCIGCCTSGHQVTPYMRFRLPLHLNCIKPNAICSVCAHAAKSMLSTNPFNMRYICVFVCIENACHGVIWCAPEFPQENRVIPGAVGFIIYFFVAVVCVFGKCSISWGAREIVYYGNPCIILKMGFNHTIFGGRDIQLAVRISAVGWS